METEVACQLIAKGADLIHVRVIGGPYLSCYTRFNPEFTDKCHGIPSWQWVADKRHFRVHYLDLHTLEGVTFSAGYEMRYEPAAVEHIKEIKKEYLGQREYKTGREAMIRSGAAWNPDTGPLYLLSNGTGLSWVQKDMATVFTRAAADAMAKSQEIGPQGCFIEPIPLMTVTAKRAFKQYQNVGSSFMFKARRVLNADGMGAGKTAQTVGAVMLNKEAGFDYKTVVVCPSSVKFAWENEFKAVCDLRVLVLDRSMNKRYEQYEFLKDYDVIIIAYDGFLSDYEEIARLFKPSILVVDECHRICNRQNKLTQVLVGGKNVRKTFPLMCDLHSVYLLSGTPITNKLEDLYTLLKLIDPGLFSWKGFSNRYCVEEERFLWQGKTRRSFWKIVGYKNEKELKAKLSLFMVRRTKDEVLPELPEKIYQTVDVDFSDEERKVYNELKKDFKAIIRGKELTVMDKLSWMTRAQQICDSLELVAGGGTKKSSKLEELIRIVNEQAGAHKIVIFSKYKGMTNIICRELAHLKPFHLNGGVESADRQVMINEFQTDPKRRLFVSTLGAGGVGVTLTAADVVIFYDKHWSPALNNQAADRLHRIGQKNVINVVTLRVRKSIEEHVLKVWASKQNLIDSMVGDEAIIGKMAQAELESLI